MPMSLVPPPKAKIIPSITEKHGLKLTDNYAWLKDRNDTKSKEVMEYLEAENAYTSCIMEDTEKLQNQLFQEMKSRIKEDDLSLPVKEGNYLYYSKTEKGKQYPIHFRRLVDNSKEEELIIDENELAIGHDFMDCGFLDISADDKTLAYAVDYEGDEEYELQFLDLQSRKILSDVIKDIPSNIEWAEDNKHVFYLALDETKRPYRVMRHELGTDTNSDVIVYEEKDPLFCCGIGKSRDKRFISISTASTTSTEEYIIDAHNPTSEIKLFCKRAKEVEYSLTFQKPYIYITTNENALNFKVMRTKEDNFEKSAWEEFIPANNDVYIESLYSFENFLFVSERVRGLQTLRYLDIKNNKWCQIPFNEAVYSVFLAGNTEYKTDKIRYVYTSLTTPSTIYDYDLASGKSELMKQKEVLGGYCPEDYVSERAFAKAKDGTLVPISMVYRKDTWGDGPCPLFLTAYGAYGISSDPYFSSNILPLLDRGYVYAIAHIRGGQELGRQWYLDGKYLKKKNTFTDFIACAEHLIEQGYTTSDELVIEGGSAGGLLMGAVTNMRPDLFKVVIADVPFVDMMNTMLDPSLPLTVGEYEEWGCPDNKEYFDYMLSYSPYDNIEAKAYPDMLVLGGLNDPRVCYWEPAKYVAKLRATKTDKNLLLLKTSMGAGHMGASGRYDYLKEIGFKYAFIFKVLGTE